MNRRDVLKLTALPMMTWLPISYANDQHEKHIVEHWWQPTYEDELRRYCGDQWADVLATRIISNTYNHTGRYTVGYTVKEVAYMVLKQPPSKYMKKIELSVPAQHNLNFFYTLNIRDKGVVHTYERKHSDYKIVRLAMTKEDKFGKLYTREGNDWKQSILDINQEIDKRPGYYYDADVISAL